jgi:two-component system, LytTR family, response regulator
MITSVIVDDEKGNIEVLDSMLTSFCTDIEVAGTAANADEAYTVIREKKPDLVFLDIEMPGRNGFELIDRLSPLSFEIIFVTAFEQYATKAFRYSAIDYLLKPVGITELHEAVERARERIGKKNIQQRIDNYFDITLKKQTKIAIAVSEGYSFHNYADIVFCSAVNSYTEIYFTNGSKVLSSSNLKHFTELLPADIFCRIHRSHLVNLDHTVKYIHGRTGNVQLSTGQILEVSQRKKEELFKRFRK